MEYEKIIFTRLLLIHLNRKPQKEITCENFSSFYDENNINQRCLLDEYSDKNRIINFNFEEIRSICPRFRQEKSNKCEINGIISPESIINQRELEGLLRKFKERYEQYRETTTQQSKFL